MLELRCYENMVVFSPDLEEPQLDEQIDWVRDMLDKGEAHLLKVENWGKKKLAYEIGKKREGFYVLFKFRSSGVLVNELERNYRLNGNILRYLVVRRKEKECKHSEEKKREEV